MKKCFFALVLPLALLLTACGKEPRPAALLLGQAADLDESETLLVIDEHPRVGIPLLAGTGLPPDGGTLRCRRRTSGLDRSAL